MILLTFILLILLLVASMFFSAAETALISLSPQKAKALVLRTPRVAVALQGWLIKPHELLTLILVGNTFVNVIFASLLTVFIVKIIPEVSQTMLEVFSWFIGTGLLVIIGEMVPKFFARTNPEKTSLFVLPILSTLRRLSSPLLHLIVGPLGFFFPKWKAPPVGHVLMFSMEELRSLLEEGHQDGVPKDESMDMMQKILSINDRRAEQIMVPLAQVDLIEIDPAGRPVRDRERVIDLVVEEGHTRTPVKWKNEIIGFIHSDDLMPSLLFDRRENIHRFISKAFDVPSDRRVGDLLQDFKTSGVHMGFVKDQNKTVIGIVTLEDVLEEITGEILDEYDVSSSGTPTP